MRKSALIRAAFYGAALWAALFLVCCAHATPVITSVDNAIVDRTTVTITGTGFDATRTGKPALWSDFENGSNPTSLGEITSWSGSGNATLVSTVTFAGTGAAGDINGWLKAATGFYLQANIVSAYAQKQVVWYKRKITTTVFFDPNDGSHNEKSFREWLNSIGTLPDIIIGSNQTGGSNLHAETANTQTNRTIFYGPTNWTNPGDGNWHDNRFYFQTPSAAGNADGYANLFIDEASAGFTNGFQMDDASGAGHSGAINAIIIQDVYANNSAGQWEATGETYRDDIYIDTGTWATAMVCNASTLALSTVCSPQIPSTRTTTTWKVTLNLDGLSASKYLYMCDNTSPNLITACNAAGFLLVASGGGGGGGTTGTTTIFGSMTIGGGITLK